MQIKKTFIYILLVVFLFQLFPLQNVAYSNEDSAENVKSEEERVRVFRNLGQFFATFFDPDAIFRFTADDIFIRNQCLRRDVFALQTLKNQISDNLIENYTTITESELEIQKLLYATYTAELVFLRNLDLLKNDDDEFEVTPDRVSRLRNRVLNRSPNRSRLIVEESFDFWIETYSPRLIQYQTCENSWTRVVRRTENIVEQAQRISEESRNLKDAIVGLGEEVVNTPGALGRNSYSTVRDSVVTSFQETRDNFRSGINDFREELNVFKLDTRDQLDEFRETQQALLGSGQDLGQILLQNSSLVALPGAVSQMVSERQSRDEFLRSQIEQSITAEFSDTSVLIFIQDLIDVNDHLVGINSLLTKENDGVITLANRINERQCSA